MYSKKRRELKFSLKVGDINTLEKLAETKEIKRTKLITLIVEGYLDDVRQ